MLVKICGLSTIEDAIGSLEAGADLLGFVFASSKRQVTVEQVEEIRNQLPKEAKTVGVFVDTPIEMVNEIGHLVQLDYVQLHGKESIEDCQQSEFPVIKAMSLGTERAMDQVENYLPIVEYLLLDGPTPGSGQRFDWQIIEQIPYALEKIILAGGLSPKNVQTAIKQVKPIGVDVSSGVETDGKKDLKKIKRFIERAKGAR